MKTRVLAGAAVLWLGYVLSADAGIAAEKPPESLLARIVNALVVEQLPPMGNQAGYYTAATPNAMVKSVPDIGLVDLSRNQREILVTAYVPQGEGPYPMILFSPGLGGNNNSYKALATGLATENNSVVLMMNHPGSDTEAIKRLGFSGFWTLQKDLDTNKAQLFTQRLLDVGFVSGQPWSTILGVSVNGEKMLVAGHSAGAGTALAVAGGMPQYRIPQVTGALILSPQGKNPGTQRFRFGVDPSLVKIPVMIVTGTQDKGNANDPPPKVFRKQAYDAIPGEKYFVNLRGATHNVFSGIGTQAQVAQALYPTINAGTAFIQSLWGDAGARAYLQSNSIGQLSGVAEYRFQAE